MKRYREYHIESYWRAEALKKQKRERTKERAFDTCMVALLIVLEIAVTVGIFDQLMEVI